MGICYNCWNFFEKDLQKHKLKEFSVEKVVKSKCDELSVKWKCNDSFNSWIDKIDIVQMSEDFPKPKSLGGNVEVNFSDYTTKLDLKSNRYRYIGM